MHTRTPLPSSFETLIDELFDRDVRSSEAPKPSYFSIDALEAAWALSRNRVPPADQPGPVRKNPYASDGASEADPQSLLDPTRIILELGLDSELSESDIASLRREFALRNHPDRVREDLRELATRRMMIANDLMDKYVARLRTAGASPPLA